MINQKLISLKIDSNLLVELDNQLLLLRIPRNKFINYCVRRGVEILKYQITTAIDFKSPLRSCPFVSDLVHDDFDVFC